MPRKNQRWWLTEDAVSLEIHALANLLYDLVSDLPRVGEWSPEGLAALRVVGATHLAAERIAVVEFGDRSVSGELAKAMTLGQVDHYVGHPWASPEEGLYPVITEALRIWSYDQRLRLAELTIVDESVHGLGATLASLLEQNSVAVVQHLAHSPEGQALLDRPLAGLPLPALRFWGGLVLGAPTESGMVEGLGVPPHPAGDHLRRSRRGRRAGGPGRLGVRVVRRVADAHHREGGGRRPGRDELEDPHYLGFPWGVRGGDFAPQAHRQAEQLGAEIVATRSAIGLTAEGDVLLLRVERRRGPHPLGDPHGCRQLPANRNAVGRGAEDAASATARRPARQSRWAVPGSRARRRQLCRQAAAHLASAGADVTMLVRRDPLGRSMSGYLVTQLEGTPAVTIRCQREVAEALGDAELEALVLRDTSTGKTDVLPTDALFVFIGAIPSPTGSTGSSRSTGTASSSPSDGADWLETSMPSVYATGDTRAGSTVAAAVGEGSTAAMLARAALQESPTIP